MVVELDDEREVEARKKQAIQNRVLDESVPAGAGRRQLIVE
jgi:transcription termination factor Rho